MFRKHRLTTTVKTVGGVLIACTALLLLKIYSDLEKLNRHDDANDDDDAMLKKKIIDRLEWEANFNRMFKREPRPVDCSRLFKGDPDEMRRATAFQTGNAKRPIPDAEYVARTRDCEKFLVENGYHRSRPLPGENDYPLAFDILVHKDVEQFERLLRAIYRPQNVYCVHVDRKSSSGVQSAVRGISSCLRNNVFVVENQVAVTWGTYSVLEADVLCMKALLRYKRWKYFINLTGQEFPLKTNWELVQILKAINGSNLVAVATKETNPERFNGRPPPPLSVTPYKGAVHVLVRREFVEYAVTAEDGDRILNWTKLVGHSSEYFFSTLNFNARLNIPGSYVGPPDVYERSHRLISRYKASAVDGRQHI